MLSFKQLKQEVGLERILSHYGILDQLEQKGKSFRGACPFCEASVERPFSASLEKNAFQCFACTASGNIFDFVARMEGMDVSKGIRPIALFVERKFFQKSKKSIEESEEGNADKKEGKDRAGAINQPLTFALKGIDPTHPFIETLGISDKTAMAFGAGVYIGRGMFNNQFVVPILNAEGELVAYNGISLDGTPDPHYPPKFVKDSVLFNWKAVEGDSDSESILVHDPAQVLALADSGFSRSMAFMADAISENQLRQLLSVYGAGRKITLLCEKDDHYALESLSRLLTLFFVRLVRYKRNDRSPTGITIDELTDLLILR